MNTSTLAVGSSAGGITTEEKKVLAATLVGTAIEWYDYFIHAQAAGLVLGPLFFAPIAKDNPALAQILAFATIGISFLFRPLGAIICGHLGDRLGRKVVLVMTLILMGASTVLIGLLPTYQQIGPWAPVLLIVLRIIQGFSAGGEWGGAALMAVEHAPVDRRSFFGSFPQIGVPIGLIIATLVLLGLTAAFGKEGFADWAWRLPFLFSIALIIAGSIIRRTVEESPVFGEMHKRRKESSAPLWNAVQKPPEADHPHHAHLRGKQRGGLSAHRVLHKLRPAILASAAGPASVCMHACCRRLACPHACRWLPRRQDWARPDIPDWLCPTRPVGGTDVSAHRFKRSAVLLHRRRRFDDTARSDVRTTSRIICRNVSSEGALFGSVSRLRARLDTRWSFRGDDSAVDRLYVRPILAYRRLSRDPLGDFADLRFAGQRSDGCRSLNDKAVHDDYLHEHPELAAVDRGVAGS
jgi:MFS family permease